MAVLSPGDSFTVELSNGLKVDAVALSFRQERAVTQLEDEAAKCKKTSDVWDVAEKLMRSALPSLKDAEVSELLDKLNLQLAQELVQKVLNHQSLSGDDKKKPASPQ